MEDSKNNTAWACCVQGDAVQWNRAAYAVSTLLCAVPDASVFVVYIGDVPDSAGVAYLRAHATLLPAPAVLEARACDAYSRHNQSDFAPVVFLRPLLPLMPHFHVFSRIICFDADMRFRFGCAELATIPVPGGIGACVDLGWPTWRQRLDIRPVDQRLFSPECNPWWGDRSPDSPYFNGGLMVFDLAHLPSDYSGRIDLAFDLDRDAVFEWCEQDMMNLVFNMSPLPPGCNALVQCLPQVPLPHLAVHYIGKDGKEKLDRRVAEFIGHLPAPEPAPEPPPEPSPKFKVVVYAISRDESQFVDRWMDSMSEADEVIVLDTGSTDGTVELLRARGAKVEVTSYARWNTLEEYRKLYEIFTDNLAAPKPWRFDVARNDSIELALRLVPDATVLVCTDLDEYFLPGWRAKVQEAWLAYAAAHEGQFPTTGVYEYVWGFTKDGADDVRFWYEKIHAPRAGRWTHPVHEILDYGKTGGKRMVRIEGVRLEHHSDPSKSRSQYLPLLELGVQERPDDDRAVHYLGREYLFAKMWDKCIETCTRHLSLRGADWKPERAASLRYIARSWGEKGDVGRHEAYLWRAVAEAPTQREAAYELAILAVGLSDWRLLVAACEKALAVQERTMIYLTRAEAWSGNVWNLYAIGLWNTGKRFEAVEAVGEAIRLSPKEPCFRNNQEMMRAAINAGAPEQILNIPVKET